MDQRSWLFEHTEAHASPDQCHDEQMAVDDAWVEGRIPCKAKVYETG